MEVSSYSGKLAKLFKYNGLFWFRPRCLNHGQGNDQDGAKVERSATSEPWVTASPSAERHQVGVLEGCAGPDQTMLAASWLVCVLVGILVGLPIVYNNSRFMLHVSEREWDWKDGIWISQYRCDLTRRDLQTFAKRDGKPWCASKGFDFSAPISAIVPREEVDFLAPSNRNARITLEVNGTVRQDSTIDKMIWSIPEAVSILSQFYCLKPGDLVFTGTPSGIGPLHVGDVVRAKCDDILPECVFEVGPESTWLLRKLAFLNYIIE